MLALVNNTVPAVEVEVVVDSEVAEVIVVGTGEVEDIVVAGEEATIPTINCSFS